MGNFIVGFIAGVVGLLAFLVAWSGIEEWAEKRREWRDNVLSTLRRIESDMPRKKGGK